MKATRTTQPLPNGDETRERILREASELFARKGYAGTSTRDIAEAVGVRQPSLFHHFPSKAAILRTLIDADLDAALPAIEHIRAASASPGARLYRFLLFDNTHLMESPYNFVGLYGMDGASVWRGSRLRDPEFDNQRRRSDDLGVDIQRLVEEGIKSGQFIEINGPVALQIIFALGLHTMRLARSQRLRDKRRFASEAAAFVLRGLLADGSELDRVIAEAKEIELPTPGAFRPGTEQ